MTKVPLSELQSRMTRFRNMMDSGNPDWKIAIILSKLNLYYFTGTMQEGMLIIQRDDSAFYWVRRSIDRALDESLFPDIKPMTSFRDPASSVHSLPDTVYLETEFVPLAMYQRIQKHFPFSHVKPLDMQIASVRAVKSPYEIGLTRRAGEIHRRVLEDLAPSILREGMDEAELVTEIYSLLVSEGHDGIIRFNMFDLEMVVGQLGFGESSIYPTSFDGPGGNTGINPSTPMIGSRDRKLSKGDLVFIDIGCCFEGYHTDKTMTYMFGSPLPDSAIAIHTQCVEIQNQIASLLKPGAIPSEIYQSIMDSLSLEFLENFMGFGKRQVKFLGHGIGLTIDETPVIAKGFNMPLTEGMIFAIEPKKGIADIGIDRKSVV
jgi:Xaa-Pro dipeptidase